MCNSKEYYCDEEKSYHDWVSQNLSYINANKQHIGVMKQVYMQGFAAGFHHQKVVRAEEELQK